MATTVRITLRSVLGDSISLDMQPGCTVFRLKEAAFRQWHVPPKTQKIVCSVDILSDSDTVGSVLSYESQDTLLLFMIVSLDEVCQQLLAGTAAAQKQALQVLGELGLKGGESAVTAVLARLDDEDRNVRQAAAETLPSVARRGDEGAIGAAIRASQDDAYSVRRASLEALPSLVNKGDERSVTMAVCCLADVNPEVRCAAVGALAATAHIADELAVTALEAMLTDTDGLVRGAAAKALPYVAERGDGSAAGSLAMAMRDSNWEVRKAAMESLVLVARQDDWRVVTAALTGLDDEQEPVRLAALEALPKLVAKGDARALVAVGSRLADSCTAVRLKVAKVLSQLADIGNDIAITILIACMRDQDIEVRASGVETMAQVAGKGNEKAIAGIISCLGDTELVVRLSAVHALPKLVEEGNVGSTINQIAALHHLQTGIAWSAVNALPRPSGPENKQLIDAVNDFLEKYDTSLADRRLSPEALALLVKRSKADHPGEGASFGQAPCRNSSNMKDLRCWSIPTPEVMEVFPPYVVEMRKARAAAGPRELDDPDQASLSVPNEHAPPSWVREADAQDASTLGVFTGCRMKRCLTPMGSPPMPPEGCGCDSYCLAGNCGDAPAAVAALGACTCGVPYAAAASQSVGAASSSSSCCTGSSSRCTSRSVCERTVAASLAGAPITATGTAEAVVVPDGPHVRDVAASLMAAVSFDAVAALAKKAEESASAQCQMSGNLAIASCCSEVASTASNTANGGNSEVCGFVAESTTGGSSAAMDEHYGEFPLVSAPISAAEASPWHVDGIANEGIVSMCEDIVRLGEASPIMFKNGDFVAASTSQHARAATQTLPSRVTLLPLCHLADFGPSRACARAEQQDDAVEVALQRIQDPDDFARCDALEVLSRAAQSGNPRATAALVPCLCDTNWFLRNSAATAIRSIAAIGGQGSAELLLLLGSQVGPFAVPLTDDVSPAATAPVVATPRAVTSPAVAPAAAAPAASVPPAAEGDAPPVLDEAQRKEQALWRSIIKSAWLPKFQQPAPPTGGIDIDERLDIIARESSNAVEKWIPHCA